MFGLRYLPDVTTLELDVDKCTGCGMCVFVCPHAVIAVEKKKVRLMDRNACMECGACAGNCPEEALTVRAGVGCAYGIIIGKLRGTEPTCDCGGDTSCC
ncbi:MAG: mercury methylation ferredoxin HgcB [Candidatus Zixiibacteriota bacterium]